MADITNIFVQLATNKLTHSILLPLAAALLSLGITHNGNLVRRVIALILWLQIPFLICLFGDLLLDQDLQIELVSGFVITRTSFLFLLLTTFVFANALSHAPVFFEQERQAYNEPRLHVRWFYFASSVFLLSMYFVFICDNLGYLWISIEATTLSSALLVYYARTKHALEATWKYLIICSVGIAFALFGTVLIFAASQHGAGTHGTLNISELTKASTTLNYPLLRLGFVFCLLGYGTKAGIFPLHSWLPDAHAEAPAPASALLSGALLNGALFAIYRLSEIVSGHPSLARQLPLALGTITVVAASFFLVRQFSLKRLWAYSSIENVGLMLVAIGLASPALFFLQALNHSLAKASLFLLSGNVIQATGAKELSDIKGILVLSPVWAVLIALSAFAVTGAPPFGSFVSEIYILMQSADKHLWIIVAALVFALTLSFIAVFIHVARFIWGQPKPNTRQFSPWASSIFPAILIFCTLIAGTSGAVKYLVPLP